MRRTLTGLLLALALVSQCVAVTMESAVQLKSQLSESCEACERYLEQIKGISKNELLKLGDEIEEAAGSSSEDADDILLNTNVQGCQAISPDLTHVCESHVLRHGWTGLDMLIEEDPSQLCADIEDCVESMLGTDSDENSDSDSDDDDNSSSGDSDSENESDRDSRDARPLYQQSRSHLVRKQDRESVRMNVLLDSLDPSDRQALEQVMIASNKGFFNPRAQQQATAAQAQAAREAQARALHARAEAERMRQENERLQARNRAIENANRLRAAEDRRNAAMGRLQRAEVRHARAVDRLNHARQENRQIQELKREVTERKKLVMALKNAKGKLFRELANGALRPHHPSEVHLKKKHHHHHQKKKKKTQKKKKAKKPRKSRKRKCKGRKRRSKKKKSSGAMDEEALRQMQEFGTLMNSVAIMNSPILTIGANQNFDNVMDEFDDRPVVDGRDSAKVQDNKSAPPEAEIADMGSNNPEQLAMLPMIMMNNPDDPKTLSMAISGF